MGRRTQDQAKGVTRRTLRHRATPRLFAAAESPRWRRILVGVAVGPACCLWVQRRGDEPWDDEGIDAVRAEDLMRGCSLECSRAGLLAVTVALRWDGVRGATHYLG